MDHLILCIFVWLIVFIVIPIERVKELRYAAVVSIIWMIFVDNISSYLGFYHYERILIPVGRASLFQLIAYSGIGIFMINWLKESSFSKLISVVIVAFSFLILQYIYILRGAFTYGTFNVTLSLIHSIAALSIFVWLSLSIIGEETVYNGNKIRKSH
jgi:hypothetical protein